MNNPVWNAVYRLLSRAGLDSLKNDPESLLKEAGKVMDEAVVQIDPIQSWRAPRIKLESGELALFVAVTEHSGNRLNSPRDVTLIYRVGDLSLEMLTVWEVMES